MFFHGFSLSYPDCFDVSVTVFLQTEALPAAQQIYSMNLEKGPPQVPLLSIWFVNLKTVKKDTTHMSHMYCLFSMLE